MKAVGQKPQEPSFLEIFENEQNRRNLHVNTFPQLIVPKMNLGEN